jgi:hypothetical protein
MLRLDEREPRAAKSAIACIFAVGPYLAVLRFADEPVPETQGASMLWTIALILMVLWAVGLVTSYTMGGFIHLLLVVAVVVVVIRLIQGRRLTG